jgi:hypothetical protein
MELAKSAEKIENLRIMWNQLTAPSIWGNSNIKQPSSENADQATEDEDDKGDSETKDDNNGLLPEELDGDDE